MHLLDVNVWVWLALAFQRHIHHQSALAWFRSATGQCLFCRITQAGFLRLATNPAALGSAAVGMSDAWQAYDALFADPQVAFAEEPQGIEAKWRSLTQGWKFSPKVWNDAYLAAFAELAGCEIVTFDQGFTQYQKLACTMLK